MKIPCTGIVVFLLLLLPNKNNAVSSIVRGRHEELKSALTSFNNKQSALSAKAAVVVGLRGGGGRPTKVAVSPKPTTASSASSVATTTATASEGVTIINLVKSIVGAAVFGLPAGIAAFGSAPSAIVPALILLVAIGGLATHGFVSIGTVCRLTQSTTYKQAWSNTVGPNTAYIPALACFMVTLCTVLTYSMILADTVPAMVQSLTLGHVVPGRTLGLLVTTTLVILPLCLMRSLAALAPFSFFGILGMVFTGVCMVIRWLSGAYTNESGSFAATLAPALYVFKKIRQLHG